MKRRRVLAIILLLSGIVFITDELWMFGLPWGHILPNLSEFHITPFGFQYHHWMTGAILIVVAGVILRSEKTKQSPQEL